jgi:TetR/AcrR family transcriptional repressor of nem operon
VGPRKTTTRKRLITTAAELFWRQGYAQTGVNEIIQQAKATSGSFYHFFPTKEDLLLAVVDHVAEVFETEVFSPASDETADAAERLFMILENYRRLLLESGLTFASPMGSLAAEVSQNHPPVGAKLAEIQVAWTARIEQLLMDSLEPLPGGLDHAALAGFVISVVEGAVLQARVARSLDPFDASVGELRNYLRLLELPAHHGEPIPTPPRRLSQPRAPSADWRAW